MNRAQGSEIRPAGEHFHKTLAAEVGVEGGLGWGGGGGRSPVMVSDQRQPLQETDVLSARVLSSKTVFFWSSSKELKIHFVSLLT